MTTYISDFSMQMFSKLAYANVLDDQNIKTQFEVSGNGISISTIMKQDYIKSIFLDEGYTPSEIEQFIEECGNFFLVDVLDDNEESGYYGLVITPTLNSTEAIIASRGSESFFENLNDWETDGSLIYEHETMQHEYLSSVIESGRLENYTDLHVTGHSLGGNNSLFLATATDLPIIDCRTFNAPGFNKEYIEAHSDKIDYMNELGIIKEYRHNRDVVSGILYNPSDPIYVKGRGEIDFFCHDLIQLSFNEDGSISKSKNQNATLTPTLFTIITKALEMLPEGVNNSIIDCIFSILNGTASFSDWLLAGIITRGAVALICLNPKIVGILVLACIVDILLAKGLNWIEETFSNISLWLEQLLSIIYETFMNALEEISRILEDFKELMKELISKMKDLLNKIFDGIRSFLDMFKDNSSNNNAYGSENYGVLEVNFSELDLAINQMGSIKNQADAIQRKLNLINQKITAQRMFGSALTKISFTSGINPQLIKEYLVNMKEELDRCERDINNKARKFNV